MFSSVLVAVAGGAVAAIVIALAVVVAVVAAVAGCRCRRNTKKTHPPFKRAGRPVQSAARGRQFLVF